MKFSKLILILLTCFGVLSSMAGCGPAPEESFHIDSITSYYDIPGVTNEEIAAIESLKESREYFSFGSDINTSAYILPDGNYAGFNLKLCQLLSKIFGTEFVLEFHEWDELMDRFDNKSIDFVGELTPTPERMESYYMTHAIAEHSLSIYTRSDTGKITSETNLSGLKVGFVATTVASGLISKYYPISFETVMVENYTLAAEMLARGEIDAFVEESVVDPAFADYDFISHDGFFSLIYNSVSMASANPEMKPIIDVVNKYLEAGGIDKLFDFYHEGQHEYAKYKLDKSFTPEEKAYLNKLAAENIKIPVGLENQNYPVSFYNKEDSEFQGIAVDILSEITEYTGIRFEAATTKDSPWHNVLEELRTGKVAMVSELLYSDARKDSYIWSEEPNALVYSGLLSKLSYPELASYQAIRTKVGVVEKSAYEDLYREWFPDSQNVIPFESSEQALIALENGDIDLLMGSEFTLLMQTSFREKPGYKMNIRFNIPMSSAFGYNKDQTILRSIIDKTLRYIDRDNITMDWSNRFFDYSRKYTMIYNRLLSFFIAILCLALASAIYLWRKNEKFRKELESETAMLSKIFTSIPDVVFCKDVNLNYTKFNPSFEKLAGVSRDEIIGRNSLSVFPHNLEMARHFLEADQKVIKNNTTKVMEEWHIYPDGTRRLVESVKTPLVQNGKVTGLLGIARDITEHKKAEEAANAASRAKSTFLAHMSHEIRTPMNAIVGMTELILREKIPHSIHDHVLNIKHASANLLSLINDILDFSKIEAGSLETVSAEYSFVSLINDVLISINARVCEKPIAFTTYIDSNIPNRLIGDEMRVRQILVNVLGNAAKYTRAGFISMIITFERKAEDVELTIQVTDSGIGIKKENLDKLFENFMRFDGAKNKDIQGTGLGLAITKRLCQAMNGDISAESEYGSGSRFVITINQKTGSFDEKFASVTDPDTKRVLIYETHSIYAESIQRTLSNLGVSHTLTTDLEEFMDYYRSGDYSFAFIAPWPPGVAARIAAEPATNTKRVLLMEIGDNPPIRNVRTIIMPVHAASVANILNDTDNIIPYNENGYETVRFTAPTASILIVDDVGSNLKVAKGLMHPYKMRIDVCRSGAQAIQYASKNRYDIIFMDHMMPEMDGIESTAVIRSLADENNYYKNVPIIALTANAVSGMKEMFMQSKMNDFLSKPIDTAKLNNILEKWIPEEKKILCGEPDMPKTEPAPAHVSATYVENVHIEGIDIHAGIRSTGGNFTDYLEALAMFRDEVSEIAGKIKNCFDNNDIKGYTVYVHAIKSVAASLGASKISGFARALESAGADGNNAFIEEKTDEFLDELKALHQNIKNADIEKICKLESQRAEAHAGAVYTPDRAMLVRLKKSLEDMDFEETEMIMASLANTAWTPDAAELYMEISENISIYNYYDAAVQVDKLLEMI